MEDSTTGDVPLAQDAESQDSPSDENRLSSDEEPEEDDRRLFPRFACEGRAQICLPFGGLLLNGLILDISESGCLVQASRITLEQGTEIEVSFETKLYKFKVDGHIARLIPGKGVGVLFHNPSSRVIFQIRELISELQMREEAE
jgi:hypothetical protein